MKSFDAYLLKATRADPDWSQHYLHYGNLKAQLREFSNRRLYLKRLVKTGGNITESDFILACRSQGNDGSFTNIQSRNVQANPNADDYFKYVDLEEGGGGLMDFDAAMSRLSMIESERMSSLLDMEVAKAGSFYSERLEFLKDSMEHLNGIVSVTDPKNVQIDERKQSHMAQEGRELPSSNEKNAHEKLISLGDEILEEGDLPSANESTEQERLMTLGDEILEVYAFVVVNVIALRQILIRYDAFVRTFNGIPLTKWLTKWHLRTRTWDDSSGCHFQDIFDLKSLDFLEESFSLQMQKLQSQHTEDKTNPCSESTISYLRDFTSQYNQFGQLLDKTLLSVERAAGGNIVFRDRLISNLRYYLLVGSVKRSLSMEPKYLVMRGRHLKAEMKAIAKWRETRIIPAEDEETLGAKKMNPENVLPLLLNLFSCFLYMMNNYIIEPSSAYYANALGSSDALSGIMIGASPWFALVSSIGYSVWTNYSYKQPILFSGILQSAGNLMYASAYGYNSMLVCLLGRCVTGLGAPRVINRRYVADATPFSLRTAASAAFAMATAVGAAMGPFAAILLDMIDFEFSLPFLGKQYFNGMTGPGYFMSLVWFVFSVFILVFFKEPTRSGLDELKRREAESVTSSKKNPLMENTSQQPSPQAGSEPLEHGAVNLGESSSACEYDSDDTDEKNENKSSVMSCFQNMTRAVFLCMSLIFMKRIALESVVGSTSVITKNRFGWSIRNVGTLHFINGMLVIPLSILAGWLSQFYEDRYLALWLMCITLIGMLLLIDVTDFVSTETESYNSDHWLAVGPAKYVTGSLIAFSGIEACESYIASLMSKVVPSALATGTFNSGLLATLVGTSGRAVGDLFITAMGLISIRNLLNLLMVPSSLLVVISIFLVRFNYDIIAV